MLAISSHTSMNAFSLHFDVLENFRCHMTDAKENKRVQALKVCKLLLRLFCIINRNASELIEKVSRAYYSENEQEKTLRVHTANGKYLFLFLSGVECIICLFRMIKHILKFYSPTEIVAIDFKKCKYWPNFSGFFRRGIISCDKMARLTQFYVHIFDCMHRIKLQTMSNRNVIRWKWILCIVVHMG